MTYITEKCTIYIGKDSTLKKRGDALLIYQDGEKQSSIPAFKIKDIVAIGQIELGANIIDFCKANKISIHFNSFSGKYLGSLNFDPALNVFPRLGQYQRRFDDKAANEIAAKFIVAKIKNQRWLLRTFDKKAGLDVPEISSDNYQEILGIEGAKSREYFLRWPELVKNPEFTWEGRSKHPPNDEINALLSLFYTILANDIHSVCNIVALDPYIGFLHKEYYGRPSLVCDFMEAYRPLVDKFVLNLINRKEVVKEDFEQVNNGIEFKLTSTAFGKVMGKWSDYFKEDLYYYKTLKREMTIQKMIEYDIRIFAKYMTGDLEDFTQTEMTI
jgi:CRISPR-associated protein Cas1